MALTAAAPTPIYSARPDDTWNQLFALLCTRDFKARFTSEFADRGPFERPADPMTLPLPMNVSTRIFDRHEDGDRAVEALYPIFVNDDGPHDALQDPRYTDLSNALTAALSDPAPRSPLARALMQIDLWSAYDRLSPINGPARIYTRDAPRAIALRTSLAKLIGRVALTPSEIAALPNNYETARESLALPDLFRRDGEWLEVVWTDFRAHDHVADFRRVARVFMRPVQRPADPAAFLKSATREFPQTSFSAVALLLHALVLDTSGHVVATPLATDVQLRTFTRDDRGRLLSTGVAEYELSRRRLLSDPSSGGFLRLDDRSEAYVPVAGNDYEFATPAVGHPYQTQPIVCSMRTRCNSCHGPDGTHIMSFAVQDPDRLPPPRVLSQPNDERARRVAQLKESRDEFKRLIALAGLR